MISVWRGKELTFFLTRCEVGGNGSAEENFARSQMRWNIQFRPKLLDCLQDYSRRKFLSDLAAGITVGIVALPLALAFGIASGATPQAGIFTAIIAGVLISALGGSRVQIGGPTGAVIVIVYGIIARYGLENLFVCTIMAGVILVTMGLSRLGTVIKFIPLPVTLGFTNGIAVLIFMTQIKDFFGLKIDPVPSEFVAKVTVMFDSFPTLNLATVSLAVGSLLILLLWPVKWRKAVSGSIVAVLVGTGVVTWCHLPVETIGSRFGNIPQGLPPFHIPSMTWSHIGDLVRPATTIALLAAIESLLSAVVADGMIDDRHDSNQKTGSPRHRQYRLSIFRWRPGHGRDCPNGDEYSKRGCLACRWHHSRAHAPFYSSRGGAAGEVHPAGHVERRAHDRGL